MTVVTFSDFQFNEWDPFYFSIQLRFVIQEKKKKEKIDVPSSVETRASSPLRVSLTMSNSNCLRSLKFLNVFTFPIIYLLYLTIRE